MYITQFYKRKKNIYSIVWRIRAHYIYFSLNSIEHVSRGYNRRKGRERERESAPISLLIGLRLGWSNLPPFCPHRKGFFFINNHKAKAKYKRGIVCTKFSALSAAVDDYYSRLDTLHPPAGVYNTAPLRVYCNGKNRTNNASRETFALPL